MAIINFTKDFPGVVSDVVSAVSKVLPISCGVPENLFGNVSNRYIVTLHTKYYADNILCGGNNGQDLTVNAWLQEKFIVNARSHWSGVGQSSGAFAQAIDVGAAAIGLSLRSTFATRRFWGGSDPIVITMKLRFEAINDVEEEVLRPCRILQSLTLPRENTSRTGFFLIPPGPNPFNFTLGKFTVTRGDETSISIGQFLEFKSIIVEDVSVTYENRMSDTGPIGADVSITFATYEMLTKQKLESAYCGSNKNATQILESTSSTKQYVPGGPNNNQGRAFKAPAWEDVPTYTTPVTSGFTEGSSGGGGGGGGGGGW